MKKEEVAQIGFEIVAYSGDARTRYLNAIKSARNNEDPKKIQALVEQGNELIKKAHNAQTQLLAKEASGENIELGFIFVHGQDHLMTTILLKDILDSLIDIYD